MDELNIPVVLGTGREGRRSEAAARLVHRVVLSRGIKSELVDVRDYQVGRTTAAEEEPLRSWREIADDADGFIIVSPEYNHGYPGELKLLLDSAYWEYVRKPVAFVGVSSGVFAGARGMEQLRLLAVALGMVPMRGAVHFPEVAMLIGEDGEISDPAYDRRVRRLLDELTWYGKALKKAREDDEAARP